MSSWDYGQGEQVADEWAAAVNNGFCRICIIRKVPQKGAICGKCQDDIDECRDEVSRFNHH